MDLYRAYSVRENYKDRDTVVVDWFCERRERSVALLEQTVQNLDQLSEAQKSEAQSRLDQLLISSEVDELAIYIRSTSGFEVKRTKIDFPFSGVEKIPDFSGRSSGMEGEYFHIHESGDYKLSVAITGFVDLSEPPNTVSAG